MAERGRDPDSFDERKQGKGDIIVSAATSIIRTEDFSNGYPETFNENLHINRGSPAVGSPRRGTNKK